MTRIVDDTFTEGSDTELSAHTPDTGTSWTKREGLPGPLDLDIVAADDAVSPDAGGDGVAYTCSPTPSDEGVDEYNVNFTTLNADAGGVFTNFGVVARWTTVDNWYGASIDPPASSSANMRVIKRVADVDTSLGTRDECGTVNCHDDEEFEFRLRTSTNRLEFEKLSTGGTINSDDSALTDQGETGIAYGDSVSIDITVTNGKSITSFFWDDLGAGDAAATPFPAHDFGLVRVPGKVLAY